MKAKCEAKGCGREKNPARMFRVRRSEADPVLLGVACSKTCVRRLVGADAALAAKVASGVARLKDATQ
jgi:hypothetical protein